MNYSGETGQMEGRGMASMTAQTPSQLVESPEAELVRQIEALIRKLAAGRASPNEVQMLQELQQRRLEMMRPRKRVRA